jgi:hypothetical protein
VDGIATDAVTPGFIINLTGERTPKLSLDRRKIRSDIREQLEQRVDRALSHLPSDVPQSFLHGMWLWDPRACHKATRLVAERKTGWLRDRSYRTLAEGASPERARESFMPLVSADVLSTTSDYRKTLLSLWELARRSPDARIQPAIVLEARGVASELRRHLTNVPKQIWDAWAAIDLGIPEACALLYGSSSENPLAIPAFMSWLTGETVTSCSRRMVVLRELLDLEWTPPDKMHDFVLSDYEAWLLGHGQFSTSWAGPTLTTLDVLLFCRNSGKALDKAFDDYASLAERFGWTVDFDRDLARSVGSLSQHEATHVFMLEKGWEGLWRSESISVEREALLARVAGVAAPAEVRPRRLAKDESEKVLFNEVSRVTERSREISLSGLCQVARALERPVTEVAADLRAVADHLNVACAWSDEALAAVSGFSEADWTIAEDTTGWLSSRTCVRPRNRIKLAALLATRSYAFAGAERSANKVLQRIERVYTLFGWEAVPLTLSEVELALGLSYEEGALLDRAPSSAIFSIPRLLVEAATSNLTLARLATTLEKFASLGVQGPNADDRYLGVTWSDALSDASQL